MKDKITNHSEWLEQQPVFEGDNKEVFENADGSQYIPVYFVECLLDQLTDTNWSTPRYDFESNKLEEKNDNGVIINYILLCGTISLNIHYGGIERNIIGCAQKRITDFKSKTKLEKDNEDFKATMFSYALCNAAKKLGNRFGRSLNGRGVGKVQDGENQEKQLRKADAKIIETYKRAVEDNDLEKQAQLLKVYDIKI